MKSATNQRSSWDGVEFGNLMVFKLLSKWIRKHAIKKLNLSGYVNFSDKNYGYQSFKKCSNILAFYKKIKTLLCSALSL